MLAILDFNDFFFIAVLIMVFGRMASHSAGQSEALKQTQRQLNSLERKLDALMTNLGVMLPPPLPSGLSPEVEQLARDPRNKIAAIKLLREQTPGLGLKEAKDKIEEFMGNQG